METECENDDKGIFETNAIAKKQKQMNFHWNLVAYQNLIHVWKEQVSGL